MVSLTALAGMLGWRVIPVSKGARVEGEDRSVVLSIGSRMVREDGEMHATLLEPPVERGGTLYLAADDAARLFGLSVLQNGAVLAFRHPPQLGNAAQIVELPALARPLPHATPRASRQSGETASAADVRVGRILLAVDRGASSTMFHVAAETRGPFLQTAIDSTGINQFGRPTGTVRVGTSDRNVELGAFASRLSGLIFRGGVVDGFDFYRADQRREVFAGRRLGDGRSIVGIATAAPGNAGSDAVGVLFRDGAYDQTIVRTLRIVRKPWGDFSRELIAGDRGAGAGFRARTRGRTFIESTVSYATRGLPLGPNDAPVSLDIGRAVSEQTTIVGGFATGPQQPLGPFVAASTRSRDLLGSLSVTPRTLSASLSYQTGNASLQVYAVPGPLHASGAQGRINLGRASVEANVTNAVGSREASVEARTAHPGINVIAGIAFPSAARAGAIAGISIPLGSALALEATSRPAGSASALRLALAIGIPARRPRELPTLPATVTVSAVGPIPPMKLFVDGIPVLTFQTATVRANVTPGRHTFEVESVDGSTGSQDVPVDVHAAGDTVALVLWPQRTLAGRVQLDTDAAVPGDFTLAGIVIVAQPGNITTETSADGSFVFARQPFAPEATVGIDAASLPRTLRGTGRVQPAAGDTVLLLRPGILVETTHFRR